jgi:hypothetical protein
VDEERRGLVVTALIRLAAGDDFRDRADAARALASFAEVVESREALVRLVLDVDDTFVTRAAAEALLRRQDSAGFAIVAEALASADDQHGIYIGEAVAAVFMVFASERDRAAEACEALSLHPNRRVREGAAELCETLARIDPLLQPRKPA